MKGKRIFSALVGIVGAFLVMNPSVLAEGTASLTVERTTDRETARPGESFALTLRVRNTGSETAHDVRVHDVLPDALTFDTGSKERDWTLGDIEPGNEVIQTYDVTVADNAKPGDGITTATASSADAASASHSLTLHIIDTLPNTGAGGRTVAILFFGLCTMALSLLGVRQASRLPSLTEPAEPAYRRNMVTTPRILTAFLMMLLLLQPLHAFAESEPITHPPLDITITSPTLTATVSPNVMSIPAGESVTLTYRIVNNSDTDATNVMLGMTLPTGWRFLDASVRQRLYPVVATLAARAATEFRVTVRSENTLSPNAYTLPATVGADGADDVSTIAFLTVTDPIVTTADITLTLRSEPGFANPGSTATLFVDIENRGHGSAENVFLFLEAPKNITFIDSGETSLESDIGTLAAGARLENEFRFAVAEEADGGTRTFTARLTEDGDDAGAETVSFDVRTGTVLGATTDEETLPATGADARTQSLFFFGMLLLTMSTVGLRKTVRLRASR